jgi:septal ring factor EnvC (AmiA/AmiB activator)
MVSASFIFAALFLNVRLEAAFRERNTKMTKATKIVASALAASLALGVAVPAAAAPWNAPGQLRSEIAQLDRQVRQAEARRVISQREAAQLDRQVDRLQDTYRFYARGGFTRSELSQLDRQVDQVKRQLAVSAHDANGRPGMNRWGSHRR